MPRWVGRHSCLRESAVMPTYCRYFNCCLYVPSMLCGAISSWCHVPCHWLYLRCPLATVSSDAFHFIPRLLHIVFLVFLLVFHFAIFYYFVILLFSRGELCFFFPGFLFFILLFTFNLSHLHNHLLIL